MAIWSTTGTAFLHTARPSTAEQPRHCSAIDDASLTSFVLKGLLLLFKDMT